GRALFDIAALGAHELAWPRRDGCKSDAVVFMRLLYSGRLKIVEDLLREALARLTACLGLSQAVEQLAVLVDAQHPVRRQALDRERAGYPNLAIVDVRLVVEVFELGFGG